MKAFCWLAAAIIMASLASAQHMESYSATYRLDDEGRARVDISMAFSATIRSLEWNLPLDAQNIYASENHTISEQSSYKRITVNGEFDALNLSFESGSYVEDTGELFFILDTYGIEADKTIELVLPEGAMLASEQGSEPSPVIPRSAEVLTDGRRIIVRWTLELGSESAILAIYRMERSRGDAWPLIAAAAAAAALVAFYLVRKRAPSRDVDRLTANLYEDEKLIVELLTKSSEGLWQKELQIRSGLNKVQMSRRIRSLERKGLVEKVPFGSSNKIRLK